jgi:hypothetical protein
MTPTHRFDPSEVNPPRRRPDCRKTEHMPGAAFHPELRRLGRVLPRNVITPFSLKFIRKLSKLPHRRPPGDVAVFTVADDVQEAVIPVPPCSLSAPHCAGTDLTDSAGRPRKPSSGTCSPALLDGAVAHLGYVRRMPIPPLIRGHERWVWVRANGHP